LFAGSFPSKHHHQQELKHNRSDTVTGQWSGAVVGARTFTITPGKILHTKENNIPSPTPKQEGKNSCLSDSQKEHIALVRVGGQTKIVSNLMEFLFLAFLRHMFYSTSTF
jgi:hypothetical protein